MTSSSAKNRWAALDFRESSGLSITRVNCILLPLVNIPGSPFILSVNSLFFYKDGAEKTGGEQRVALPVETVGGKGIAPGGAGSAS